MSQHVWHWQASFFEPLWHDAEAFWVYLILPPGAPADAQTANPQNATCYNPHQKKVRVLSMDKASISPCCESCKLAVLDLAYADSGAVDLTIRQICRTKFA